MMQAELALRARAGTGEGALWDWEGQRLYWVDIPNGEIHRFDPKDGTDRLLLRADLPVGTVVRRERGGLIAAMGQGVYAVDEGAGSAELLCPLPQDRPGNRCNDGKCDPAGRLWVGTMATKWPGKGLGSLYRVEPDGACARVLDGLTVSNGIAWSADGATMYYTDTAERVIWAYDYDLATGGISHRRTVVVIAEGEGGPDGFTIDSEGMLWVAQWGGWQVGRYDPSTGEKFGMVRVPAAQVSSCAFGGEGLDELFITTALGGQEGKLENQPLAGSLFRAKVGVKGVKANKFKG